MHCPNFKFQSEWKQVINGDGGQGGRCAILILEEMSQYLILTQK